MKEYRKQIWSNFIKAVKEFNMVEKGDRIALGISGGKDSLMLLNLFLELKKDKSFDFDFVPITLNSGLDQNDFYQLNNYLTSLNCNHKIFDTNIWKVVFDDMKESNPCSLCASMRRAILYKKAEELNCNKLALGHHYDDIIETALINMFYGGSIKTMLPNVKSTKGKFNLIRPMCYVMEKDIISYISKNEIPVIKCGCRISEIKPDSKRAEIKELLKTLEKNNPLIKKSIFNSLRNVNLNYIMGYIEKNDASE